MHRAKGYATAALSTVFEQAKPLSDNFSFLYKPGGLKKALDDVRAGRLKASSSLYLRLVRVCRDNAALREGKLVHALLARDRLQDDFVLANLVVEMYIRCGSMVEALQAFKKMSNKDVTIWTKMISAFAQTGHHYEAFKLFRSMQLEGVEPNRITFVGVLGACICLEQARLIHALAVEGQCEDDIYLSTALVTAYGTFGCLKEATNVFERMTSRDIVSWTALITAYTDHGHCTEALHIYERMHLEGLLPNRVTCLAMLSACTGLRSLSKCKLLHSHVIEGGWESDIVVSNSVVWMYDKCGSLEGAKVRFDEIAWKDVVSWTSIISAYGQRGRSREALHLFRVMKHEGQRPNSVTFMAILEALSYCSFAFIAEAELVHRHIVESGLGSDLLVATSLVTMYGKFKPSLEHARGIFQKVRKPDLVLWNAMLSAYAQHGLRTETLDLFERMQQDKLVPDNVSYVAVLTVLNGEASLYKGRVFHEAIVNQGYESDHVVMNALINMYGKCLSLTESRRLFDKMPDKSIISWNTMVAVYAQNGEYNSAQLMFRCMQQHGIKPDKASLSTMLYACTSPAALSDGRLVHGQVRELGYQDETALVNALIIMYGKCGTLEDAVDTFERISCPDVGSWNAMIAAYGYHGECEAAKQTFDLMIDRDVGSWNALLTAYSSDKVWCKRTFRMFQMMQVDGIMPNTVTIVTTLSACSNVNAVNEGRAVHKCALENGLNVDVPVGNAIIDLYAKVGNLVDAKSVFDHLVKRDAVTWNTLLAGYAQHGHGKEAIRLFALMQAEGMAPNKITLMSVIHACGHLGWVKLGCQYFKLMSQDYGFLPVEDHFNCAIDMLGRSGHLGDAEDFLKSMPVKASIVTWMSLLGSCKIHGNLELATIAAEKVVAYDPENSAVPSLLDSMWEADKNQADHA